MDGKMTGTQSGSKRLGNVLKAAHVVLVLSMLVTENARATAKVMVAQDQPMEALARLGQDLQAYRVRPTSDGFEAQDSKEMLKADFTARGVTFRVAGARLGMALRGVGYGDDLKSVESAMPRQVGVNRVEYRRGAVTEWYVNGPLGVEQGFMIAKRSDGANGRPLTIELALSRDLDATIDQGGTGLTFSNGKSRLRYVGLSAREASGKELPARLGVRGQYLLLKVDDAGAQYPIAVDPFVQLAELTASDGISNAFLGSSVAVSGNTVIVGTSGNNGIGAAYVFEKPANGWQNMTQTAKLTSSDESTNDGFGDSVTISGTTVVVGAPFANVGGNVEQGAAYVFVEPVGGWTDMTETGKLTTSDGAPLNFFGTSLGTTGGTIVSGASGWNGSEGKAYVFVEPPSGWQTTSTFSAILTASHGAPGDSFGLSTSISGNTVVAGAPNSSSTRGVVYIFVSPKTGWANMTETARLSASDGRLRDVFGHSVSIAGTTVAAGAPGHQNGRGAAYVFVKPSGGWRTATQNAELTASDGISNDGLGVAVSVSSNAVLAGAPRELNTGLGVAYTFSEPAGGWTNMHQSAEFSASNGITGDWFGFSVALDGSAVVVGAPQATVSGNTNQGAAYVFGH
jgi:hypothetical protein